MALLENRDRWKSNQPRGVRNNNPLNIRKNPANKWLGIDTKRQDKDFECFTSMVWGFRAAFIILGGWFRKSRSRSLTPRQIISKWAPASENNVDAYCNSVHYYANLLPMNVPISVGDRQKLVSMVRAMAIHENGQKWADLFQPVLIDRAYEMAFC